MTENKSNPKKPEDLRQIGEGKNSSLKKLPTSPKTNGRTYKTDSDEFSKQMSKYFANVSSNLSKSNESNISKLKIFPQVYNAVKFYFHKFTENEVSLAISNAKSNSALGTWHFPKIYKNG